MPITISGSTGIAGVDGSASTPAVQGTDTNTGIVFPAADTVTVATGGSERMRVDSSGNVGIGTSSPSARLSVSDGTVTINSSPSSTIGYLGTVSNHPIGLIANNVERGRFDTSGNFLFNSGYGSIATAYGCRAWVYFNGTGTVAINASGNVTSITDNGVGTYTVNFTNAMPDANYCVCGTASNNDNNRNESVVVSYGSSGTYSTTAVTIWTTENTSSATSDVDSPRISVAIFR
jgi:hypothetical protein